MSVSSRVGSPVTGGGRETAILVEASDVAEQLGGSLTWRRDAAECLNGPSAQPPGSRWKQEAPMEADNRDDTRGEAGNGPTCPAEPPNSRQAAE